MTKLAKTKLIRGCELNLNILFIYMRVNLFEIHIYQKQAGRSHATPKTGW